MLKRAARLIVLLLWLTAVVVVLRLWVRSYSHWDHLADFGSLARRSHPGIVCFSHGGAITVERGYYQGRLSGYALIPGGIDIPFSSLTAGLCLILLLAAWREWTLASRRRYSGVCPACGYDLRATPERCPECGRTAV